jgi:sterol desaturase/sphingolipid hydroxylase (fatty acid hydroxylase superfamily)
MLAGAVSQATTLAAVTLGSALVTTFLLLVWLSPELRRSLRGTGSIRQTLSNAGVGVVFLLSQLVFRGALVAVFAFVSMHVPWKLPEHRIGTYVVTFVLLDFIYYCQHRLEHQVPVLWAIHAVHHQSIDYNWSVSFRVGALASLTTICFHSLLALAGVDPITYAAVGTVHAMLLFGLHAKTKFTFGPGRIFNAPLFHRVHHASNEAAIDRNFGGVLLVFDRVLGTFTPWRDGLAYGVVGQDGPIDPLRANAAPWIALASTIAKQRTLPGKLRALFVRS